MESSQTMKWVSCWGNATSITNRREAIIVIILQYSKFYLKYLLNSIKKCCYF